MLPKTIPGTVHIQFLRSCKVNCKCSRGELHGAYYYHFVRINGKLRKRYLKESEVEEVKRACISRQRKEKAQRLKSEAVWKQLREIRERLREFQNLTLNPPD